MSSALGDDDSTPRVLLTTEEPYVVQSVNAAFASVFGYPADVVSGRTIAFLQGPKTDGRQLKTLACLGKATGSTKPNPPSCKPSVRPTDPRFVVLYTVSGHEVPTSLSAAVVETASGPARVLTLRPVEAIPLDAAHKALQEAGAARVIVEVSGRHESVLFTSTRFLDLYGLRSEQVGIALELSRPRWISLDLSRPA